MINEVKFQQQHIVNIFILEFCHIYGFDGKKKYSGC